MRHARLNTSGTPSCKGSGAGRVVARGHWCFGCTRDSRQRRQRAADDGPGFAGRRLLARQQRQGLQARPEPERQGLRRPRQRQRQRGPLPGTHADDDHYPDDSDDVHHADDDYYSDDVDDDDDSDHDDDSKHEHDDHHADHFDDADRLDDNDDGSDVRGDSDYANVRRDGGRRNSADEARASEGTGEAGQRRARDGVPRPQQSERATVHRLPGLAAGSDRLSNAGRRICPPEGFVLRV